MYQGTSGGLLKLIKISNAINSNDNSTDKKEVIKEAIPKNNNSPIFYI